MKKLSFVLGLLVLMCNNTLQAIIQPQHYGFGLEAEWIYLCPLIDDTYFAAEATSDGRINGKRFNNDLNYHTGVRVEGLYAFCAGEYDLDIRLRWTFLHTHDSKSVLGVLVPTNIIESFSGTLCNQISSDIHTHFQNIEALAGLNILNNPNFEFDLRGGIQYSYIKVEEDNFYTGASTLSASQTVKTRFHGVGPELMAEGRYYLSDLKCFCFPGNLSLVGKAAASLLVSWMESDFFFTDPSLTFPVFSNDEKTWKIVPFFYIRSGLNYSACFNLCTVSLELGYEFMTYYHAIGYVLYEGPSQSFQNYRNFGAHGPYVAIGVGF